MSFWKSLSLIVLVGACTPLRYAATQPPRGSVSSDAGEASATVRSAELHGENGVTRYGLEIQTPTGTELGMVYLNSAYEPRCNHGGIRAVLMRIDGRDRWSGDPVPIAGGHALDVDFVSPADIGSPGPRAIDVELETPSGERCLRVPLRQSDDREAGWELQNVGAQGFGMDAHIPFHTVGGVNALMAIRYEIGFWTGPLRIAAQPGPIGLGICSADVCGKTEQGQTKAAPVLPLGLGITAYPVTSGMFALGFEARLRENFVWLPAETGTERFWIHAPQGVLHLALAPPTDAHGLPGGPQVFSLNLEIPVGALIVHKDGRTSSAPMLGVGLMVRSWL